jgi:alpha-L-glutamate ligase-like protein
MFDLKERGVLGINARNQHYIMRCNPRRFYPLVDNKFATKQLCLEHGINTPELYGMIRSQHEVRNFASIIEGKDRFVIKPARGSGGNGIIVVDEVRNLPDNKKLYIKSSGASIPAAELRYHMDNILSGLFSLGGRSDQVLIEYCVALHPFFKDISYKGVPDVRIIVYQGVPVMAMLRLPTRASDGKANLHTGGLGLGLSLSEGVTTLAVQFNRRITMHPDHGHSLTGLRIPHWDELVALAAKVESVLGLHYVGVDIVLDADKGPMLLEANARPGISIQIANNTGLKHRLDAVDAALPALHTIEEKIAFAQNHF